MKLTLLDEQLVQIQTNLIIYISNYRKLFEQMDNSLTSVLMQGNIFIACCTGVKIDGSVEYQRWDKFWSRTHRVQFLHGFDGV